MPDDWSIDLPGFDERDPSTWHPEHATVASPMQKAARMLGVRLGTNMAPAIEHLARALFPVEQATAPAAARPRSCPTCSSIGPRRLIGHDGQGVVPCPDPWHAAI